MSQIKTHGPDFGLGKKTKLVYITGFILCVILTVIPFGLVMDKSVVASQKYTAIFICALLQFLVQVVCFLRVNARTLQAKVNLFSFIFSIFVLVIIVGGSLWIMWNLNYNMMH